MPFPEFTPTMPVLIRRLAEEHQGRELIVCGERRLSYAEAEAQSARMARALLEAGVGKGTRVGLLMPNDLEWLVAFVAAARIGAITVPINTFFKARELHWTLRHADVDTLLTSASFLNNDYLERLEEMAPELAGGAAGALRSPTLPYLRRIYAWGESGGGRSHVLSGEALADGPDDPAVDDALLRAVEEQVFASDALVILYSSGSTADPKGAVHSHGALIRHAFNLLSVRDLRPDDRVWSPMPFFWVGGLVFALLGTMEAGATLLVEHVFDPASTLAFLERERVTVAVGWPHFGKALADHPDRAARDLSSLRAGNVPDLLPPEICPTDPELRPNGLGMTETCGPHTYTGEGQLPEALRGSFGASIDGVEHRICDPDTGAVLSAGVEGEICVRGYSVMQGLYKREREESFDADGFYHTGDGGSFSADGQLYFKSRLGDMIKSGGANVTPSEVESLLLSFPELKQAHVVGVRDAERGENVAAAVVLDAGAALDADALRSRAKAALAAYKVPRHVWIADEGVLPFTDSGKIDKRRLRTLFEARIAAGES